jgi:serine/threonine protein kinase
VLLASSGVQPDGKRCLVLEHCGRGSLDILLHHSRSPLDRPPIPAYDPAFLNGHAAAAASSLSGSGGSSSGWQHLTRPDLLKLLPMMRGVVRGLTHLHTRNPAILHRDIKPANLLVSHGFQVSQSLTGAACQPVQRCRADGMNLGFSNACAQCLTHFTLAAVRCLYAITYAHALPSPESSGCTPAAIKYAALCCACS